jgi:hypothetical protein
MENKDEKLWAIAKKRAGFKKQLFTYVMINLLLWALWVFTKSTGNESSIPWPAWVTLGWGIGIVFAYYDAYNTSGDSLADKEYEKLKNKS